MNSQYPEPDHEHYTLSERDRAVAEQVGKHVVAHLLTAAQNKEIAGHVIGTYTAELQMVVGRAVLRLLGYLLGVAVLIASFKLGILDKVADFFGGPR
jgi:hypothetical protein